MPSRANSLPTPPGLQSGAPEGKKFGGLWKDKAEADLTSRTGPQQRLKSYRVLELNQPEITRLLAQAPMEFTGEAARGSTVITLATPDGKSLSFRIQESPVMSPELIERFPQIKTYSGQGIDDPTATMRLSMTPRGLNAFVISARESFMLVPYSESDDRYYVSFFTRDVEGASFECLMPGLGQGEVLSLGLPGLAATYASGSPALVDVTLRQYNMAFAVTQQFYQRFGGPSISPSNDLGVVAAITAYVNSVNAIYEREAAVRFRFHSWIADRPGFCHPSFNCFPPDQNVGQMMQPNQFLLDNVFPGAPSYDIGAALGYGSGPLPGGVSSFGSGGMNGVGGACENGFKAQSATVLVGTAGDYMGTVILAHEWGHMFGARHTFSSLFCSGSQLDAIQNRVEPGSGSTIMSYAPICPPENLFTGNPSSGPDNYFHIHSLFKIANHKSIYSSCGQQFSTGNSVPAITNGGPVAHNIPNQTPFTLTAAASDANGDALTYAWEEWDPGATFFRSYRPTASPSRTFPSLPYILNNGNVPPTFVNGSFTGEALPAGTGSLFFTVTVRDNRGGGGGVVARDSLVQVNVVGVAGPFKVTFPNAQTTLTAGSPLTVMWNVAGTNLAPVSTSSVRILLSTDGGSTFPTVLANSTPNDGAELVTLPNVQVSAARIKVEAVGNIYFDISDASFGISNISPNLSPYQPAGWSDRIVVSNTTGTTTDSSPLRTTDNLYVDWAVVNSGSVPTGATFFTRLLVDGVERGSWFTAPPLGAGFYGYVTDYNIGTLGAGTHTIKILTDVTGVVPESSEADNEYTKTITVLPQSAVQFSSAVFNVSEGAGSATITVMRGGVTSGAAAVNYSTSDTAGTNCAAVNGAASSRCDYITKVGTLNFAPNETSKIISVPIVNDSYAEGSETLTVTLSGPSGLGLGTPVTATLTITDNDAVAGANPIAQPSFFVSQHYFDFLNRDPDATGLAFWTNQTTGCGNPDLLVCRINASAAFFLSPEFQDTGFYVIRMQRVAFGRKSAEQATRIDIRQFTRDASQVGAGFVDGQLGAQQVLEQNKQAYATQVATSPDFIANFPVTLSPEQYVGALFQKAGVAGTAAERQAAVNAVFINGGGTPGRVAALRSVTESASVRAAEFRTAFVLLQYLGYLRRDPDQLGYDFWLGKLNEFGGNYVAAEMVKAFITSPEYRARFGPN